MEDNSFLKKKPDKYMWSAGEFQSWIKEQIISLKQNDLYTGTAGVTRMLYSKVLLPNNIDLSSLIKKEIKLSARKWKRREI